MFSQQACNEKKKRKELEVLSKPTTHVFLKYLAEEGNTALVCATVYQRLTTRTVYLYWKIRKAVLRPSSQPLIYRCGETVAHITSSPNTG